MNNVIFIIERKLMSLLVKFQMDWADEHDVYGIRIMGDDEWKRFQEVLDCVPYPQEMYFGTNEELNFKNKAQVLNAFEISTLTDEEVAVFKKFFGKPYSDGVEFGWDPIDQFAEVIPDEDFYRIYPENK
jgi:hypothetical protein